MFEIHVALIFALVALFVARRRQPRLPGYDFAFNDMHVRDLYAKRLILTDTEEGKRSKRLEMFIDKGQSVIKFPGDIIDDEHWQVSLRCGRGKEGFRFEFFLETPDDPPHHFVSVAFSPGPVRVSLLDRNDTVIAKLP